MTRLHDARQTSVSNLDFVILTAFAAKVKAQAGTLDLYMAIPQRGQSERLVFPCIFVIADANKRRFEQSHDSCQYLVPRQSRKGKIVLHSGAYVRQHFRELDHAAELCRIANLAIAWVISILPPPAHVGAQSL
jgi:hypothetical protein